MKPFKFGVIFVFVISFTGGTITGFIVSRMNSLSNYVLDNKINVLEGLNILTTSMVAIAIGWYIAKKLTEIRYEKEYIIEEVFTLSKQIKEVELMINSSDELELKDIIPLLTNLALQLEKLTNTINVFSLRDEELRNLKEERSELHIALTNTPKRILTLDPGKRAELKILFKKIDCDIKRFILNINKL